MKLTALEIKQQQFEKSLRGYDVSEVNAYLSLVASEWEHMVGKMKEMEAQLDKMDEKLKHYERVEEALHETLQTAKESADQKLDGAKKESRNIIEKAEIEADSIIKESNQRRQQIRQSIMRLLDRREEIIGGMKSYLDMAQESLQNFSRDDTSLFSLPKEDLENKSDQKEISRQESAASKKRSRVAKEQPIPPGAESLDDILKDID
jgi:cell division initiation protein